VVNPSYYLFRLIINYFESFVGGGAFLFLLQLKQAYIYDLNPELINCYRNRDVGSLASPLGKNSRTETIN